MYMCLVLDHFYSFFVENCSFIVYIDDKAIKMD